MKYLFVFAITMISLTSFGQNPKFDQLEISFAQGHYKRVVRKSNRLLDKPEYDYSLLPSYYKSIALFELSQNRYWLKRRPWALTEAKELFLKVKSSPNGAKVFNAHMYELAWLRNDMIQHASDLKRMGAKDDFLMYQEMIDVIFEGIEEVDNGNQPTVPPVVDTTTVVETGEILELRDEIVLSAKQHIGTPYVWAGNTPEGFDCSGFTSFVMKKNGESLPRRAADQYKESVKIKQKNASKGDLVFFNNGSGISHVGILISEKGEPLVMVHASSSKGVIITEIDKSTYWKNRLHGFGSYLDK